MEKSESIEIEYSIAVKKTNSNSNNKVFFFIVISSTICIIDVIYSLL